MKKLSVIVSIFAFLAIGFSVFADLSQIEELKSRGILRIALNSKDTPPFFFKDENGNLRGIEIELASEVCKGLGVKPEFIRTTASYNGLVEQVARDEADVAISWISITASRSLKAYFSQPYMRLKAGVLVSYQSALKHGWKEKQETFFKYLIKSRGMGFTILSETGSWHSRFIAESLPEAELILEENWEKRIPDLLSGKIHCILFDGFILQGIVRKHPELHIKVKYENLPDIEDLIGIPVNPKLSQLVPWLNNFLELNRHRFFINDVQTLLDKLEKTSKGQENQEGYSSKNSNVELRKRVQAMIALGCLILFGILCNRTMRFATRLGSTNTDHGDL